MGAGGVARARTKEMRKAEEPTAHAGGSDAWWSRPIPAKETSKLVEEARPSGPAQL